MDTYLIIYAMRMIGTDVLASCLTELQDILDNMVRHSENLGLHINIKKTKVMVFSKKSIKAQIKIKGVIDAFEMYLYRRMLRLSWI